MKGASQNMALPLPPPQLPQGHRRKRRTRTRRKALFAINGGVEVSEEAGLGTEGPRGDEFVYLHQQPWESVKPVAEVPLRECTSINESAYKRDGARAKGKKGGGGGKRWWRRRGFI